MKDQQTAAPQAARIEAGNTVMLYDPSQGGNFVAELGAQAFDPDYWQAQGALRGAARGRGNTWFFALNEHTYALRHYRRGGWMAKFSTDRYLRVAPGRSRPEREFALTRSLHAAGLPVPVAVAARLQTNGYFYRGDLLTRQIPNVVTLAERLAVADLDQDAWHNLGSTVARFHRFGLDHADLNAHNVLCDAQGQWWLIDFDRGCLRTPGLWCDANLVRLRRSILKICDGLKICDFDESCWLTLLRGYRDDSRRTVSA